MASIPTPAAAAEAAIRRVADLPGPRAWPVVGNAFQVGPMAQLHQRLEAWREEHGDLFRVRLGQRTLVVCADPQVHAALLRERSDAFRRTTRLERFSREFGFTGVFASNGDDWRRQRPMVMAAFDPAHTRAYFGALQRVTGRVLRRWTRFAEQGAPFVLRDELMRYTVDVTCGLAFGEDTNTVESTEEDLLQRHIAALFQAFHRRLLSPLPPPRWWPGSEQRALTGHIAHVRAAIERFIARSRERLAADPGLRERPQHLIDAMVAAREREGSGITDADVAGNVFTMLLAGEDTTAHTLAWLAWLLHRHPQVLARARAEVDAALEPGAPLPSAFEQVDGLDFVEACALEALRLKPVAPFLIREAARATVLAGVALEPGMLVCALLRPAALDARHYKDPQAFDPARWLADEATPASAAKRIALPFGAGPRMCPGRYLALLEIKAWLAMLLRNFDIAGVRTPHGGAPREHMALAMGPEPFELRLAPRARDAGFTPAAPSCS